MGPPGPAGKSPTDAVSKTWVLDVLEQATSLQSTVTAKLEKKIMVTGGGLVLKHWTVTKHDQTVAQVRDNGEFVISQPSSIAAYIHVQAPTLQTSVAFELYSNSRATARDTVIVTLNAGKTISILLHYRILKSENVTVRILGNNLDLIIQPQSRVEITLLRRWHPPELIISGHEYPWPSGT